MDGLQTTREQVQDILDHIQSRHSSENDIPPGPMVTWTDEKLAWAVQLLLNHIEKQDERIASIERTARNLAEYNI